ncbi:MAG: uracil phosphoribosyltransferase, partial [Bacteroidaceae bacterium]|nr:uracil phosphoribosyltransferase [Bacteroidaceae bacterium]
MKIVNLCSENSIVQRIMSELRDVNLQKDSHRFRWNLQRLGQIMAYELSKTLTYEEKEIQTPLAVAKHNLPVDSVVLATIFRAGLPFHQGFLDVFDSAENAFVSAYRYYKD